MDKSVQNERAYQLSKALEYIKHHNKNFSWRKIQEIERKTVKEERRYVVQLMQSTLERVEAKGPKKGREEVALNMIKNGFNDEVICSNTGLSPKEIKQLKCKK